MTRSFPTRFCCAGVLRLVVYLGVLPAIVGTISMPVLAADRQALFYYVPSDDGWESLSAHASKISILAPQVFIVDANGQIHGNVEDRVRSLATEHGIELMPLLANDKPEAAHAIVADEARRQQVIAETLRLCQAAGCAGIQLDIEGVLAADANAFTAFVRDASDAFRAQHLLVSIAVPSPLFKASLPANQYKTVFAGFGVDPGGYKLDQIVRYVDFVSLMLYGEYGQGTQPGPVASVQWVEQSIRYVLQFVPPSKLSLGVGLWAQSWCNQQVNYRRYSELQAANVAGLSQPKWDKSRRAPWFEYEESGCHTTVWFENRRSLREKFKLINQLKLLGFSAWRLGQEDPDIWNELHARNKRKGQTD